MRGAPDRGAPRNISQPGCVALSTSTLTGGGSVVDEREMLSVLWPVGDSLVCNHVLEPDTRDTVDELCFVDERVHVELANSPGCTDRDVVSDCYNVDAVRL